jgi:hypothetical protein
MPVPKTDNVIDPASNDQAVLSQCLPKQADELLASQLDALNQAHHHPHVRQHRRVRDTRVVQHHPIRPPSDLLLALVRGWLVRQGRLRTRIGLRLPGGRRGTAAAAAIVTFLLRFPAGRSVVGSTSLVGTLATMVLPATEGTTQVQATRVTGVREKPNAALYAGNDATLQLRMGLQDRVQSSLILADDRLGAIVLVPVIAKRENFPDCYDKKARLSVIMQSVSFTPSSYLLDAKASRGRARTFSRPQRNFPTAPRHNRYNTEPLRRHRCLPSRSTFLSPNRLTSLLERKNCSSSFQVVAQFI